MEFLYKCSSALRWSRLVIANSDVKRRCSPRFNLLFNEIVPRVTLIVSKVSRSTFERLLLNEILVRGRDFAQIAEMQVKRDFVFQSIGRNCRHDDVAAISRVARRGKVPGLGRISALRGRSD